MYYRWGNNNVISLSRYMSGGGCFQLRIGKLELHVIVPRSRYWKPCYHTYVSGMGYYVHMWTIGIFRISWLGNKRK